MDFTDEVWAFVDGFNYAYEISNYGKLRSHKYKSVRILKPNYNQSHKGLKYQVYALYLSGRKNRKIIGAHRLVAAAFIPNPENKPDVNHIDNNPENNYYKNLEWCTHRENMSHAAREKRMWQKTSDKSVHAKITKEDAIRIYSKKETAKFLAKEYGVSIGCINSIRMGITWWSVTGAKHKTYKYERTRKNISGDSC